MEGVPEPILGREVKDWNAAEFLRKRIPQAQYNRRSFDRIFYRNCLFYVGLQWIRYSRTAQQWRPIAVPDWFPKQITNKFAVGCDFMKSVFLQSDPQSIFTPASAEPEDLAAANSAKDITKCIELEVGQSELESLLATWISLTGNGFVIDGYDNDATHGTKFIPDMMCLSCAKHIPAEDAGSGCPYCRSPNIMEAKDGDGVTIGKEVPIGRMFSEVAGPFELHMDLVAQTLEQSPYVYRARTYPLEMLKDMFPEHAKKFKTDDAGIDSGMFYQTALAYITNGTSTSPGNYAGSVGSIDNVPRGTLYHLWVRPTKNLPEGAEAMLVGNTEVWKSELTKHDEKGNPFVPVTHFGFNTVPGRIFAKTPADDAIFKQIQKNKMEAFIQMAMERTSNPTWLLPKGIGIDSISGQPGEKIWYNFIGGAKPERVGGSELPGAVFRWMDTIEKEMMDIFHTGEVMRGHNPKSLTTFGATQILLERAYAGYANALKNWGRGMNNVRRNRLNIWKEYASDERTMMVLGKNKQWEAKKFSKDAIKGRINVYLEEASVAPKSKAYDQLITSQLIEAQLINIQDPAIRVQVMNIFDVPHLVEDLDIDIKDALKEKEEFVETHQLRPRKNIDNEQIHYMEHVKVAKSDEYKSWPDPLKQEWVQHIMYHKGNLDEAAAAAAAQDPHIANAKARLEQIQLELEGMRGEEAAKTQHLQARKEIDLQTHAVKKGIDVAIDARKAAMRPRTNGQPAAR